MTTLNTVWIIGESLDSYPALAAVGRRLGNTVEAVWIGSTEAAQSLTNCGVDAVRVIAKPEDALFEDYVGALIDAMGTEAPSAVLFATSKRIRLAAARAAAAAGTRVMNDVSRIWVEEGSLLAEHMVFGGAAFSIEQASVDASVPAIALLAESLLVNEPAGEGAPSAAVSELPSDPKSSGFKLVERKPRTVEAVNLTAARRVVSVGRGIQNKEDLALIDSLAAVLEAEVGCTRPIAEGQDWMSRERYIGVSGVMLKPDLFVTVGVSGQVQHMVGAAGAKTIIAINKDKNAPVFKQVDYGIVGDLYEVVPKIVETMKA
ncbi:MAG: FAD-binding protein [Raoultibacter sp.]